MRMTMMKTIRMLLVMLVLGPTSAYAADTEVKLDTAPIDLHDNESLQRELAAFQEQAPALQRLQTKG